MVKNQTSTHNLFDLDKVRKKCKDVLSFQGLFLLCLCTFLPKATFAYYPEIEKDFFFVKERSYSDWPQGERRFVIYDNYSYSLESGTKLPFISPLTNEFVPADIIIGNIPLTDFFRENLGVQDHLANLLYADLRLKKILEEYAQVQKSAYELIHGIEKSGPYDYKNTLNVASDQSTGISAPLSPSESAEVYKKILNLQKWKGKSNKEKNVARRASLAVVAPQQQGGNHQGTAASVLSFTNYKQSQLPQVRDYYPNYDSQSPASKPSRGRESYNYDIQLPWFLSYPMKTFNYLMRNKAEAIFYFFITLIPVYIISSSRSR